MATKKTAPGAKKKVGAKPVAAQTTTRITTVKAVESKTPRTLPIRSFRTSFLRMPILSASIVEFIGVFLLAVTALIVRNEPFYIFITFIGIFMLVGGISGAHVNPAITVAAWITKRIGWVRMLSYILAQFLGAILALVVMSAFIGQAPSVSEQNASFGQAAPQLFTAAPLTAGKEQVVLFAELIGLAVLGFAYAGIMKAGAGREKATSALTIGGAGFVAMAFASTVAAYVGSSVALNPAVAVSMNALNFTNAWSLVVYVISPLLGAAIGFFLYDLLRSTETISE